MRRTLPALLALLLTASTAPALAQFAIVPAQPQSFDPVVLRMTVDSCVYDQDRIDVSADQGVFPDVAIKMAEVGEATGALDADAKILDAQGVTATGQVLGSPAHMAPEQIEGGELTIKSDIYSLGLVLYELFTGKQAFIADNVMELIKMHQTATPTNASEIVKGIDPLVESVIAHCLEKNPAERFQSDWYRHHRDAFVRHA